MARHKEKIDPQILAAAYALIQDVQQSFGYTMRVKRRSINVTLKDLELMTSIPNGRLSQYERALIFPGSRNAHKIINALNRCGLSADSIRELHVAYEHDKLHRAAGKNRR